MKNFFYIILLIMFFPACDRNPTMRQYVEIFTPESNEDTHHATVSKMPNMADPQMAKMLASSTVSLPLKWDVPQGWKAEAGSGLRLATFKTDAPNEIICTIVILGGSAGGLQANVTRWLGQTGFDQPDQALLTSFINKATVTKTKLGAEAKIIDLTEWMPQREDASSSMIATMIDYEGQTIFVKMTGAKKSLVLQRKAFVKLCESLKVGSKL